MGPQLVCYVIGIILLFVAGFNLSHPRLNAFALGWAFLALGFLFF